MTDTRPPLLFLFGRFGGEQQGAQIPVAKAIDGKLSAIDDFQNAARPYRTKGLSAR